MVKKNIRRLMFLSILVCCAGYCLRASASTPYSENGRLSVKSGKIVNSKGKTFVIQGVSTHGIAWYSKYITKKTFRDLRDNWGVNTIRLAMYTEESGGYCSGGDQTKLKKQIENGVKYATSLGMYVIIDWHILSDGNPLTNKAEANSFFKYMAKKYKNNGHVIYEICNEPNGSGGTWKNIRSYAKTIIKTIRSYDKNAIIVVGTPTWSQDIEDALSNPITGYRNIAYSFHFYAGTHQDDMRARLEKALKKKLAVLVTEFGISDASGGGSANTEQGDKWISLLDKYSVGRVVWSLSNKDETCSLLKSSCTKVSGFTSSDLSASGTWLVKTYTGKTLSGSSASSGSSSSGKSSSSGNSAASGSTSSSSASSASEGSASGGKSKTAVSSGSVSVRALLKQTNSWRSGGYYYTQYTLTLKNTKSTTCKNWKVKVTFSGSFTLSGHWCGSFSKKGYVLVTTPADWNKILLKNGGTEVGFILKSTKALSVKKLTITAKGSQE